jgi:hypothetical protein
MRQIINDTSVSKRFPFRHCFPLRDYATGDIIKTKQLRDSRKLEEEKQIPRQGFPNLFLDITILEKSLKEETSFFVKCTTF